MIDVWLGKATVQRCFAGSLVGRIWVCSRLEQKTRTVDLIHVGDPGQNGSTILVGLNIGVGSGFVQMLRHLRRI